MDLFSCGTPRNQKRKKSTMMDNTSNNLGAPKSHATRVSESGRQSSSSGQKNTMKAKKSKKPDTQNTSNRSTSKLVSGSTRELDETPSPSVAALASRKSRKKIVHSGTTA